MMRWSTVYINLRRLHPWNYCFFSWIYYLYGSLFIISLWMKTQTSVMSSWGPTGGHPVVLPVIIHSGRVQRTASAKPDWERFNSPYHQGAFVYPRTQSDSEVSQWGTSVDTTLMKATDCQPTLSKSPQCHGSASTKSDSAEQAALIDLQAADCL